MNRLLVLSALFGMLILSPAAAEGGGGAGGVEFTQAFAAPGGTVFPLNSVGGFGYGVMKDGSVIGGFGMGVHSRNLDAGYGGMLQGWQHRWGPLVGLVTTKIGIGGLVAGDVAGLSLYGAAEAQLGLLVFPWFDLGFKAGVAGTATMTADQPFALAWSPVVGLSLSWGSY